MAEDMNATTVSGRAAHTVASQSWPYMWDIVDGLIDRAPDHGALKVHGIIPLAIRRARALGRELTEDLALAERLATFGSLSIPGLLTRAREAHDGPIILFKGPLVARGYPGSARTSVDIDLIVEDAHQAQRNFLAAGFVEIDEPELYADIHHLRPLRWPPLPILNIELHSRAKWPEGLVAPDVREIFAAAVEGELGVDGVLAPDPYHHTMLLAAHGWAHSPLRSLRDLLDVAVMADGLDRVELARLARRWDLERVWKTTLRAIDHLFGDARRPAAMRLWAGHLDDARERTVLETHLEHWLAPFWGLPPRKALAESGGSVLWELRPVEGESWRDKLERTWQAARRSRVARSEHEAQLGELATRGDLRRLIEQRRAEGRP
jgi:Uncharacterised nucleotidyltransferase